MQLQIEWTKYTRTTDGTHPCIFHPFNFQLLFLIENWFLSQFTIQYNT